MGKVIIITEAQALAMKGKEFTTDMYFNPIQDAKGNWVISEEEMIQYKVKPIEGDYSFIKSKPLLDHEPKAIVIDEVIKEEEIKPIKDEIIKPK